VAAGAGRQPEVGLPLLQARHPPPGRGRRRVGDQHRVVRRVDGLGHVADLLHRLQGVRVNALAPGPVNTPLLQELFAKDPVAAARRLVHVPAGRFAEVREIAAAALFLASDDSSYVNATNFLVDGGISQAYTTPE
jgi:NAD(P)-dependent dehydrogenase (short-subunit alcohol dehydrogenase family)